MQNMVNLVNVNKMESIITAATEVSNLYTAPLLKQWSRNKQDLFSLFGNKLTVESEINDSLSSSEITLQTIKFLNKHINNNEDLTKISDYLSTDNIYEELINNTVINDQKAKGTKLSKYLSRMVQNPTKQITIINNQSVTKTYTQRELFDINFSMLLQSIKVKSKLIISIDPIDYLTMSISGQSWKSCHNIVDGCHRAGTLSYMTDSCTAIAYIANKNFNWNNIELINKRWRQAVYIDINNKSAIFSRQYPNNNEVTEKVVRNLIGNMLAQYHQIPSNWKINHDQDKIEDCIADNQRNSLHYNDILKYSNVTCSLIHLTDSFPELILGNEPICPCCGDSEVTESEELFCENCKTGIKCSCCDGRINENDVYYQNGNPYCEECFNQEFSYCEECEEYVPNDEINNINNTYVCDHCLEYHYTRCERCGEYFPNDEVTEGADSYDYCSACWNEKFFECNECGEIFSQNELKEGSNGYNYCQECFEEIEEEEEETEIA